MSTGERYVHGQLSLIIAAPLLFEPEDLADTVRAWSALSAAAPLLLNSPIAGIALVIMTDRLITEL